MLPPHRSRRPEGKAARMDDAPQRDAELAAGPAGADWTSAAALAEDCLLLLEHVTRQPDSRLDWCFEETRLRMPGPPPAVLATPPAATPSKGAFLERVVSLGCRLRGNLPGAPPPTSEDIAFLVGARDFLAGLARPATVESILITGEFVRATTGGRLAAAMRALAGQRAAPGATPGAALAWHERCRGFGQRLAFHVSLSKAFALVLVIATVLLSIQALVGRGLLVELGRQQAFFGLLAADIERAAEADAPVFLTIAGAGRETPVLPAPPHVRRYCDYIVPPATAGERPRFATRQQQMLCDRYDGVNRAFITLYGEIRRWSGSVFVLAPFFGARVAEKVPGDWDLALLQQLRIEEAGAEVRLRAIAEYLLPCLYAALGALAAVMRHVARRTAESTLDFSDRGLISRSLVLGVLFGAVIGLFASQIGLAERAAEGAGQAAASLTPAALALLAGYSVTRVFEFFDGLAMRVFGPPQRSAPGAGGPSGGS